MEDFYIITKPVSVFSGRINAEYFQTDYLLQELFKAEPAKLIRIKEYAIDKSTVSFQTIQGILYVAMIAFKITK